MSKISVVINTLNEEKNLPIALSSIKNFADEIVVVDMKSNDKTVEVAKSFGAKVYEHEKKGYVEPARNFAISKATGDWVLILDADEELGPDLKKTLQELSKANNGDYFRIPRKNIVFGKWLEHSRWWPDYNIRFFRTGFVSWNEMIHSVPLTQGTGVDLDPKEELAILHYHYQTIEQFIERMNRYTTYQVKALKESGYKFNYKDLLIKPTNEFFSRYFQGEGYKDGVHGLGLSILQAFSEAVLYLKFWQSEKFINENVNSEDVVSTLSTIESDLNYWKADMLVKQKGSFIQTLKRKFHLP